MPSADRNDGRAAAGAPQRVIGLLEPIPTGYPHSLVELYKTQDFPVRWLVVL